MKRFLDITKGMAAAALTILVLGGIPYGLIRFVGWPLPTDTVSLDTIGRHVTDGDVPDVFVLKTIALVVWFAWLQLTVAVVSEYVGIVRGRSPIKTPTLPGIRLLAAKLATWTTLMLSAFGPIKPVAAAPLAPVAAAQPLTVVAQPSLDAEVLNPDVKTNEVSAGRYEVVRGDSWWDLSERLLGDGMRWSEIRDLNLDREMPDGSVVGRSTESLREGWLLRVPVDADATQLVVSNLSEQLPETVVVEGGDHFWAIAKETLTDAWGRTPTNGEITPYWIELVELNRANLLPPEDPNLIYPEQRFALPEVPSDPNTAPDLNGVDLVDPPEVDVTPIAPDPTLVEESEVQRPAPETPSTTASTTVVTAAPTTEAPTAAAETAGTREGIADKIAPVALVAAGSAFLGGTILFALRRLRSIQSARRRPGTITDPPNDEGAEFERRIRAISVDGEDVRYVAAANSYLSHQLESSGTPMPAIVVVRAGQFGVELLLDEPCTPVQGFRAITNDKTVWRLEADLDARAMEQHVGTDAHPYAPALTVIGNSDAGNVLVDLEQLGSMSVEGDAAQSLDFQRGLVASLCSAPWATNLELVALGIDGLEGEDLSRVVQPADGLDWAERVDAQMRRLSEGLDRSPYEERVMHGDVYHPTVVIIGPDPGLLPVARKLAAVADLAYSPIAVVSAHALASEHRIVIESDQATLEPLGLSFDPVALAAADLSAVDHLLANASDTGARPPAEDWATQGATKDTVEPEAGVVDLRSTNGSATARQQTTPTSGTIDRIAAILDPKPIEVRILGRRPEIEGLADDATPKIEAIIVYLAFHREVVSQRFREEFWPESTSRQAADNALMRARKLLGLTEDGDQRLQSARSTSSYVLCDEIGLDWDRVELLVSAAKDAEGADEAAFLDAALCLVEGHVAVDARPDHYAWLLREPTIYTLIETTIVDAAYRRGELALATGEVDKAQWAAEKGLAIVDGQEAMYRMKMQAAADAGDVDAINAAYREAQRAAESYGYDDEVQPETQELFEHLVAGVRSQSRVSEPGS